MKGKKTEPKGCRTMKSANNININYKKDDQATVVVRKILSNQFGSAKVYNIYVGMLYACG